MTGRHPRAATLRAARSLLVLTSLAIGLALAFLPAHPGVVAADEMATPPPSAAPAVSPGPPTDTPQPTLQPSPAPTNGAQTPDPSPGAPTPAATLPADTPLPSEPASPDPGTAPPLSIAHVAFARLTPGDQSPAFLAADAPLLDQPRFAAFRIRFEVVNTSAADQLLTPLLELVGPEGVALAVPADFSPGVAINATGEWVARPDGGTQLGPPLVHEPATASRAALVRSSGINPMPAQTVPAASALTIEFSLSPSAAAVYGATYRLRLTDAGAVLTDAGGVAVEATLSMTARPRLELSPGQRSGISPEPPRRLVRYGLQAQATSIHAPAVTLVSDSCAACHRSHTAPGSLLSAQPTEYALCASCHDGGGLPAIGADYAGVPANDPAARAYYQHDPGATEGVLGTTNNCAECHNPHNISSTGATQTAAGWTASGRIAGTGVALEYQLCYRCHAAPATLPANAGQPASRYALDKAVELDPGNASYHPIEAAGTNATAQMDASLAGTSPYKLWDFTSASTVRCVNCHADSRLLDAVLAGGPALPANANLPVHASAQRSILIAGYQDRTLKSVLEPYSAADFALCYVCHAEAPFVDTSGDVRIDTNFRYHGLHVSSADLLNHGSDGTNIDTPGDGGGLATCAECHFRIHSTAYPVYGQPSGSRLVVFAPNVSGGVTPTSWTPRSGSTAGTCSLKCHGQPHTYAY